jgi:hypothetical protein
MRPLPSDIFAILTPRWRNSQVLTPNTRGQKISVNAEIVQFVKAADNAPDECLVVFGKDQLLRVRGTLEEVTRVLSEG